MSFGRCAAALWRSASSAHPPVLGRWLGALLMRAVLGLGLGLGLFGWTAAQAQQPQPVPALTARVMDMVGVLDAPRRQALEAKLAAFEAEAGPQIVVLLVATTQPEDIASYAQRVGEAWKIGRRGVGDGLLLVVARDDRKLWIAPAKALEGAVPDLAARQIVRDTIGPAFKRGDYAGGLDAGIDQLIARIRGEHLPAPVAPDAGPDSADSTFGLDLQSLALFFFIGVPVLGSVLTAIFGRKLGALFTGGGAGGVGWLVSGSLPIAGVAGVLALILVGVLGIGAAGRRSAARGGFGHRAPPVIFGGGGWGGFGSGGGGSGGGGGGFSSGGGGDFGGGGAGGDW